MVSVLACGPRIEEEPPIPEHRIEPCETWCAMIFDPVCPVEVEVETEQECFEGCLVEEGVWAPVGEGHDDCAATHIPFVECMDSLSCEDVLLHYELINEVPVVELPCGPLLKAQVECQAEHY